LVCWLVADAFEALAFERVNLMPFGGVGDVEVEHGPNEGEAAGLAGEAADHLGVTRRGQTLVVGSASRSA
jgi:hypothetical protein